MKKENGLYFTLVTCAFGLLLFGFRPCLSPRGVVKRYLVFLASGGVLIGQQVNLFSLPSSTPFCFSTSDFKRSAIVDVSVNDINALTNSQERDY